MSSSFDEAFGRLIGHEGGFQADPRDDGNWTGGGQGRGECKGTKFGISARSYPDLDIRNLTLDQARAIYKRDFWDRMRLDSLPFSAAFQVFDMSVHSGAGNAARCMQRAVRVMDDGVIGPATMSALSAISFAVFVARFNAARLRFMRKSKRWLEFSGGWTERIAINLELAE